ncbi:MAG: Hpt domain-containing protein, partial [Pseudomonadota bacterium]
PIGTKAMANIEGLFDFGVLEELTKMDGGEGRLIAKTIDLFQEHSKPAIIDIAKAAQLKNTQATQKAAHALKSMSLNLGASKLSEICKVIEHRSAEGRSVEVEMIDLKAVFAETHKELPTVKQYFAKSAA